MINLWSKRLQHRKITENIRKWHVSRTSSSATILVYLHTVMVGSLLVACLQWWRRSLSFSSWSETNSQTVQRQRQRIVLNHAARKLKGLLQRNGPMKVQNVATAATCTSQGTVLSKKSVGVHLLANKNECSVTMVNDAHALFCAHITPQGTASHWPELLLRRLRPVRRLRFPWEPFSSRSTLACDEYVPLPPYNSTNSQQNSICFCFVFVSEMSTGFSSPLLTLVSGIPVG